MQNTDKTFDNVSPSLLSTGLEIGAISVKCVGRTHEQVFSETGLMPAIAKRADERCSLCFGFNLGVSFVEEERSTLGKKVSFDEHTPEVVRLLCIIDVLYDLHKNKRPDGSLPLDELLTD